MLATLLFCLLAIITMAVDYPDIHTVPVDLSIPTMEPGPPRAGVRTAVTPPEYEGTEVHHVLYLPINWQPDKKYPLLVEYAGNGNYDSAT